MPGKMSRLHRFLWQCIVCVTEANSNHNHAKEISMKQKHTKIVLVVALILMLSIPAIAANNVIKWKVQGFVPAGMLFHDTLVRLADEVKRVTSGRLVWEIHPAGSLVPPFEGLNAVSHGVYQANFGYSAMWVGKIPASPLFTSIPGGFNVVDMQLWLEEFGGKELYQEMYDKYGFNVKVFPAAPITMEDFMWAKKPLRTLEDFKGLKMRMMPLMGDVLAKHGFSVIFVPGGEIMPNLQRGVLDAAEYSVPAFTKDLGIWEVCKYVITPGVHQPTSGVELIVNKKAWESLPEDLKPMVEAAIGTMRLKNWLYMEKQNLDAIKFFKEKGITEVQMAPETIQTFNQWAREYLDELAAKDEFFKKVWDSQKAFGASWYPYDESHHLTH